MLFPDFFSFLNVSVMKLDYEYYAHQWKKTRKKERRIKLKEKEKKYS